MSRSLVHCIGRWAPRSMNSSQPVCRTTNNEHRQRTRGASFCALALARDRFSTVSIVLISSASQALEQPLQISKELEAQASVLFLAYQLLLSRQRRLLTLSQAGRGHESTDRT